MQKRVFFIHPAIHNAQDLIKYLRLENESYLDDIIWDSENPQIVVASEMIYNDNKCFSVFKKLFQDHSRIFVFQGGEAVYPDMNIFDYAITQACDDTSSFCERIVRMPPHVFYYRSLLQEKFENKCSYDEAKKSLANRKFCNFIYSNPYSHPMRDNLFHEISKYKKVDSLGAHLNNTGTLPTRRATNWGELSIELKANYKFSISSENALCEGYTSEKMLASLQAHSIPIYWGNPSVASEYNEEAFINCHSFSSIEEIVKRIKEIDNDDEKWIKMVTAPWQTKEQIKKTDDEFKNYLSLMKIIFGSDTLPNKKAPFGTFMGVYYEYFFRHFRKNKHLIRNYKRIISRKIKLFLKHRSK